MRNDLIMTFMTNSIQSGAAGCGKGIVMCFLKVPLACFGSMAAAVQPNDWGTLIQHVTNPSEQLMAPDCTAINSEDRAYTSCPPPRPPIEVFGIV